jgi:hypothetical protein
VQSALCLLSELGYQPEKERLGAEGSSILLNPKNRSTTYPLVVLIPYIQNWLKNSMYSYHIGGIFVYVLHFLTVLFLIAFEEL